nr:hypothetical protein [uncultured bacterium]
MATPTHDDPTAAEAPAAEALARRIAELSPERRAVLERLLRERRAPAAPAGHGPIEPRDRSLDPAPLSFAQRRLWLLDRLAPGGNVYNESSALHLRVPLDVGALRRTLDEIVRRHEVLRTTFAVRGGEPVQVVAGPAGLPLRVVDVSRLPAAERLTEAERLLSEEARRPIDLERGPVVRATLVRMGPADHLLGVALHHIACDGWWGSIFFAEFSALYEAFAAGRPSPLAELPVQYADYAVWQRRTFGDAALAPQLAYWKRQLAGVEPLRLATDRPRRAQPSYRGERCDVALPRPLVAALRSLSAAEGATLFMTLLAAFQALLHRYTGQDDVAVGTPVANRARPEVQSLVGFFVNTLVLRGDCSGDPTFRELLGRVRRAALGAYAAQDVPFERVVEEVQPRREPGRNPLFDVSFQLFTNGPLDPGDAGDAAPGGGARAASPGAVEVVNVDLATSKWDLRVDLTDGPDGITGFAESAADLFDRATVERLVGHYGVLLRGVAEDPDRRLSELPLLGGDERRRLLVEWNATARPYPRDRSVHALFAEVAAARPDAPAVLAGGRATTYRELDERSDRLARYLARAGVRPGALVGVNAERSADAVVSVLAVLKAGAAYLPLDPAYPAERLRFLAADADARVVVGPDGRLDALGGDGVRVVDLSREGGAAAAEAAGPLGVPAGPLSPAYAMHTSGSTGAPKGVVVPHRAVVRLARGGVIAAGPGDVVLHAAPLGFDASTLELWGALLNGAAVAVHPAGVPALGDLARTVRAARVTHAWLTAPLFHGMVEHHLESLGRLRHLLAGGDVLAPAAVRRARAALPRCRLTNGYGPTENTTFTCTYDVPDDPDAVGASVPIGRPVAGTRVYVLDGRGAPVPVGVPGELYAGGDGVALGYLRRPELDAERFVPDPFAEPAPDGPAPGEPPPRLYRTGDVVRWRADGVLEFLGRTDRQVKVRGFRVEPEEVEAALGAHPDVREAACLAREEAGGERRLVAYASVRPGAACGPAELRRHLEGRLPGHLVPSAVVVLDALPVGPNGKVDRGRLAAVDPGPPRAPGAAQPPRAGTERRVARLWQEVLEVEQVGAHDNLFDLGGHSLTVIRLHERIRAEFGVELPIVELFRHPTVRALAGAVAQAMERAGAGGEGAHAGDAHAGAGG